RGAWYRVGGTSAGAPQWAALVALADQARAQAGLGTLAGTPALLAALPAADFHDVTSGGNGFAAAAGFDQATGRGSPNAALVVAQLAGTAVGVAAPAAATTTAAATKAAGRPTHFSVLDALTALGLFVTPAAA